MSCMYQICVYIYMYIYICIYVQYMYIPCQFRILSTPGWLYIRWGGFRGHIPYRVCGVYTDCEVLTVMNLLSAVCCCPRREKIVRLCPYSSCSRTVLYKIAWCGEDDYKTVASSQRPRLDINGESLSFLVSTNFFVVLFVQQVRQIVKHGRNFCLPPGTPGFNHPPGTGPEKPQMETHPVFKRAASL